jgi:hypothetical protein
VVVEVCYGERGSVENSGGDSMRGGWCSKEVGGPYDLGVWKCIKREWEGFSKHVRYEVGDGSKVRLWHDVCCDEQPLNFSISELFSIACGKDDG